PDPAAASGEDVDPRAAHDHPVETSWCAEAKVAAGVLPAGHAAPPDGSGRKVRPLHRRPALAGRRREVMDVDLRLLRDAADYEASDDDRGHRAAVDAA